MKGEQGSIALEMAVVLPFFIVFCLFLSWLLALARAEALLRDAVQEAVKTAAAYAYPVGLVTNAYQLPPEMEHIKQEVEPYLPYTANMLIKDITVNSGTSSNILMEFVDRDDRGKPLLNARKLEVKDVLIPTFSDESHSYFGMTAEYRVQLPLPFMKREIVLRETAVERCWVGKK